MIERINTNSVNSKANNSLQTQPHFKGGLFDAAMAGLLTCEQSPMMNVTVLDLSTAIIPRTVVEGQTNVYSGFEAFRRESSGLLVNCIFPSFIVMGVAKLIKHPIVGDFIRDKTPLGEKSHLASCWANEETINTVRDFYSQAQGKTPEEKIRNTWKNIFNSMEGLDGDVDKGGVKKFKDLHLDDIVDQLTKAACTKDMYSENAVKGIYYDPKNDKCLSTKTGAAKTIWIVDAKGNKKAFGSGLDALVKEGSKILREFHLQNITDAEKVSKFAEKSVKLVKWKSLGGLAIIFPLAISVQPLNRWWTSKVAGKKGAPIYKDFTDSKEHELNPDQKRDLLKQKFISIGTMIGAATLSIVARGVSPIAALKNVGQFSAIFPTMDQARVISTATFASRMGASEDKNELKESTMRDIATFFSFYFIGDYVAKAAASVIEHFKKDVKLVNNTKELKSDAGFFKRAKHWLLDTNLKATEEVLPQARKYRALCQAANIGFSLILLGLVIPKVYRHNTDKAREKELKKEGVDPNKYYPKFEMNDATAQNPAFKAISSSNN